MPSLNPNDYTAAISEDPNDFTDVPPSLNPDDYTAAPPSVPAVAESPPAPDATAPQSSLLRRAVADPLISLLAKGTVGVGEAAVGLANIAPIATLPTLGNLSPLGLAGKAFESVGGSFPETHKFLSSLQSPELQAAQQKVADAEGLIPKVKATLQNPSVIPDVALQSILPMLAGGGIARTLVAQGLKKSGGTLSKEALKKLGIRSAAVGEGAVSAGLTGEGIRQQTESGTLTPIQALIAAGSGAAAGLVTVLGAGLANRLGFDDIDQILAGTDTNAKAMGVARILARIVTGAMTEAPEELLQSSQEAIAQNIALGKPWDDDVAQSAVQGLFAGLLMGGVAPLVQQRKGEPYAITPEQQQGGIPTEPDGRDEGRKTETPSVGDSLQRPAPSQEAPPAQQGQRAAEVADDLELLKKVIDDEKQKAVDRFDSELQSELDRLDKVESEQQQRITEQKAQQQLEADARAQRFADLIASRTPKAATVEPPAPVPETPAPPATTIPPVAETPVPAPATPVAPEVAPAPTPLAAETEVTTTQRQGETPVGEDIPEDLRAEIESQQSGSGPLTDTERVELNELRIAKEDRGKLGLLNQTRLDHLESREALQTPKAPPAKATEGENPFDTSATSKRLTKLQQSKPRPLNKLYGPNPTPEQQSSHKETMRVWNRDYRAAQKAHKEMVAKSNEWIENQKKAQADPPREPSGVPNTATVLNTAKDVALTVPEGATFVRVVTATGKRAVVPIASVKKGNVLQGAGPFVSVEAGIKDRKGEFKPVAGEVTATPPAPKVAQSVGPTVDNPIAEPAATQAVNQVLGTSELPSNITFTNEPDAEHKGRVTFAPGQLPQIEINLAKHDSPDSVKDTLIHELVHPRQADPAMARAVDAVAKLVSDTDRARKAALGYNADETQVEAVNELIRQFYAEHANSNIFQRAVTSVIIAAKRLFGIDLTARQAAIVLVRDAVKNHVAATSGEGMARVEEDETAEDDDLTATQVQGVPMGVLREIEHLKPIVEQIRTSIFDSTKPITEERTDDARDILSRFVDPNTKGQEAATVRAQLGNVDAGPALVMTEIWRYAEKMAIAGDPSMLREMIPHYQTFALLGEAGAGGTTIGRALRALQETGTLFDQLYKIEKANAALAGREMRIGPELMEQLLEAIRGVQISPDTLTNTLAASEDVQQAIEEPFVQAISEIIGRALREGQTVDVSVSPQEQVDLRRRIMEMFPQARYRKFYTEKGAENFVEDFFRLMSGQSKGGQEGLIWTADRLLMGELRRLLLQKAAALGIKPKPKDPANLYDQIVQVLGKGELRRNKIEMFDKLVRAEIEAQRETAMERAEAAQDEESAQRIVDAATGRAEMLLDAWNEIVGTLALAPASNTMLRRVIADQFKKLGLTWNEALTDAKVMGRVIEFALRDIQEASSERKLEADFPALDLTAMRQALELEFNNQLQQRRLRQEALEQKKAERLAQMMAQRPERESKRLLDSLEKSQTEWLKPEDRVNVQKVIAEFLKTEPPLVESQFVEPLAERLRSFGAQPDTATQLATEIYRREMNRWSAARVRMMNRASLRQSVQSLVESIQLSPYRAQSDPAWRQQAAMDWFMASGLSREQAEAATRLFEGRFNAVLAKARETVARRVLDGEPVTTIERAIAAIRSGVLDPSQPWSKEFAEKAGITPATPEQFKRLAELDEQYSQEGLSLPEKELLVEQMSDIFRQLNPPPEVLTRLAANFVSTLLTGIQTTTINIFAPMAHLFSERMLRSIANPTDIRTAWRGLVGAWSNWLSEAKFTVSKDAFSFLGNDFQSANNVLKTVWEEGLRDIKSKNMATRTKGLYNILRGSQQYTMRFLNAADQANMIAEREAQTVLYGTSALKQFGFGVREVDMFVQSVFRLKEQAYQDGIDKGLEPNLARVRADSIVIEQLEASLAEKVGDTEAAKVVRAAELDAYNITGRLATKEGSRKLMRETDEGGLISRTILHPLLELSSKMRKKEGFGPAIAVSLLGYVNVPIRTARFYAWNGPYGLFVRFPIYFWRKYKGLPNLWNQTLANEYQVQHRLKMAITSTAVMMVLAALGKSLFKTSDDDDNEDGIFITGKGPKNKQLRDAWTRQGFSANGIYLRINGQGIRLPLERLGEPLAHIFWPLAAMDDRAWRKREAESSGRPFDETTPESIGYAIGTYMALLGQRGLIQQLTRIGTLGSEQGGQSKILASQAAQMVSASVTPYLGLQNSVDRLFEAPADRSSIEAAIIASFPVLGVFGDTLRKRQVNRFGDPLYDQSWFAKAGTTGIPLAVRVSNTPENQRLYSMIIRSGVAPPELRRYLIEERYGPLTENQWQQFALRSGRTLKQDTLSRLPELESLPRADAKRLFQKLGSDANNATAMTMGLERINAPEPRTVASASSPKRSSIPSIRLSSRRPRRPRLRGRTARIRRPRARSIRLPRSTTRLPNIRSRRRSRLRYA